MTLAPEDFALLRLAAQTGLQRFGEVWHAGRSEFPHAHVRRLWRAGYLAGSALVARATVTDQALRAIQGSKAPSVGTEIVARGQRRTLRGRVVASEPNRATLTPLDNPSSGSAPVVYEVRRPHAGAPWKGREAVATPPAASPR
jgi:hypothetical protein